MPSVEDRFLPLTDRSLGQSCRSAKGRFDRGTLSNGHYLHTAVATRAALMTCHFKSTLTLARADRRRRKSTAAKILKAPLSAHLGIDETSSDALNETDTDLNSENSSAPGETGGQSQGCESSVARPIGSEAAIPAPVVGAASGEGSPAIDSRDEGYAKAVIAQHGEPSVEAAKNPPAGKVGRNHEIGGSVAVAPFDAAAVDPLTEASAALDDKDYATAQRLFAANGRKDVAEAIKDALAALDRRDYAKAQGLFEALGQKAAAAAHVKGSAPASPPRPKPAALAGGPMGSVSLNEARRKPVTSPPEVVPVPDAAYRRPLPQVERAKARRLKLPFLGTGVMLLAIFGVSAIYGSPLNWTFPTTKSQAVAGLSSAANVLKADLAAPRRSRGGAVLDARPQRRAHTADGPARPGRARVRSTFG
jgi:hypothetical protein